MFPSATAGLCIMTTDEPEGTGAVLLLPVGAYPGLEHSIENSARDEIDVSGAPMTIKPKTRARLPYVRSVANPVHGARDRQSIVRFPTRVLQCARQGP